MTWTVKIKYTRPNNGVDFYTSDGASLGSSFTNSERNYVAEKYRDTGKLISITTSLSENGLDLIKTFVCKDEASKEELRADSRIQTFVVPMREYNTANNISQTILQNEAT